MHSGNGYILALISVTLNIKVLVMHTVLKFTFQGDLSVALRLNWFSGRVIAFGIYDWGSNPAGPLNYLLHVIIITKFEPVLF